MATTQYKCTNFGMCDKALQREVIEIEDGEEAVCPECGEKLIPPPPPPRFPWVAVAVGVLVAAGLGAWLLVPKHKPVVLAPVAAPIQPARTSAPVNEPPPIKPLDCSGPQIAAAIMDRYRHDEHLNADSIHVDVANKTIILSGTVENDLARNYAAALAQRTDCPIVSVVNDLRPAQTDQAIANQNPSGILERPRSEIAAHPRRGLARKCRF